MGRTRTQLRQETARQLGLPFIEATSTASSVTTLTDADELGRFDDDQLIGAHVYLNDATFKTRVITDNVQSTGVITFRPSDDGGMDGTDAYEILPFAADAIHSAIDEALLSLYDNGILVRKFWLRGVTGSPIYNGFPEYWTSSSALHGWTVSGLTLARSQAAGDKYLSEFAAALSTGAGTLTLDSTWRRFFVDFAPNRVDLYAWVKSGTASSVRVGIVDDAGTATWSSYHSGDGEWELLYLESHNLTDTDTEWTIRVAYDQTGTTDELGGLWIAGGFIPDFHPFPIQLMPAGPTEILISSMGIDKANTRSLVMPRNASPASGWEVLKYHDEAADVELGIINWAHHKPPAGRAMWILGDGPFKLPTADSDVVELNQMESLLVAKAAAIILLERNLYMGDRFWADRLARLGRDVESLARGHGSGSEAVSLGPTW